MIPARVAPLLTVPSCSAGSKMWTLPQPTPTFGSDEVEDPPGRAGQAGDLAALGVGAAVAAADVDHPAVRGDGEAVRLARVGEVAARAVDEALALVVRGDRRLAVGADEPRRPLDRAEQVVLDLRLRVAAGGPAHRGVERAPALEVATPGDRVVGAADVGAVTGRVVGRVPAGDRVDLAGRAVVPRVPLVGAVDHQRQLAGGRVHPVAEDHGLLAALGGGRPRADQPVEEVRVLLGVGRRADAEEPVAVLDVGAQRVLLRGLGKDVPVGVEEGDRGVGLEVRRGEVGGVVGDRDAEAVLRAEVLDRDDARVGGGVGAVVEDEDLGGRLRGRRSGGRECEERAGRQRGGRHCAQVSGGGSRRRGFGMVGAASSARVEPYRSPPAYEHPLSAPTAPSAARACPIHDRSSSNVVSSCRLAPSPRRACPLSARAIDLVNGPKLFA